MAWSGRSKLVAATAASALAGGAFAAVGPADGRGTQAARGSATALLRDADGRAVERVDFRRSRSKVTVRFRLARLTPSFHGFRVHATGRCDPNTTDPATGQRAPFLSAGGHWNPRENAHGAHAGDMPPLLVMRNGRARGSFETDRFRSADLIDEDGLTLIVHGLRDNLAHIPTRYHSHSTEPGTPASGPDAATLATGDAGPRVACGVIRIQRRSR